MKTKILLIVTGLIFIVAGFNGISSQQAPSSDVNALRTEVAGTVIAEIYSTVQAEFSTIATQMAKTPEAQSGIIGEGFVKPTEVLYAHMAKLTKQDKNYLQYKMYEDWDVTFTFKNVGLQDWTDEFYLRYYKGEVPIEGKIIYLPALPRGESTSVTLHFDGKDEPGIYNSYWELINNDGAVILDNIFVAILVK